MKINIPKEWSERMGKLEDSGEIGAGALAADPFNPLPPMSEQPITDHDLNRRLDEVESWKRVSDDQSIYKIDRNARLTAQERELLDYSIPFLVGALRTERTINSAIARAALELAAKQQPPTMVGNRLSAYDSGYLNGVLDFAKAIRATSIDAILARAKETGK